MKLKKISSRKHYFSSLRCTAQNNSKQKFPSFLFRLTDNLCWRTGWRRGSSDWLNFRPSEAAAQSSGPRPGSSHCHHRCLVNMVWSSAMFDSHQTTQRAEILLTKLHKWKMNKTFDVEKRTSFRFITITLTTQPKSHLTSQRVRFTACPTLYFFKI